MFVGPGKLLYLPAQLIFLSDHCHTPETKGKKRNWKTFFQFGTEPLLIVFKYFFQTIFAIILHSKKKEILIC